MLCLTAGVAVVLVSAGIALADISFDEVTWGGGGDTLGWDNTNAATISSPGAGGNPDGFVNLHFDAAGAPLQEGQ